MEPDSTVTSIVVLLADGRVARLDPNPAIGLQLDAVIGVLSAAADAAPTGDADA